MGSGQICGCVVRQELQVHSFQCWWGVARYAVDAMQSGLREDGFLLLLAFVPTHRLLLWL
jgi:hypothetical protein